MGVHAINVLLVEDDPDDALLVRDMLAETEGRSIRLREAGRLADGLKLLDQNAFDLILLDLSLPDSRGIATLATMRTRAPNVPIVVLTGSRDQLMAIRALQGGAQDYLIKGQDTAVSLARSIRYAIARQQMEERLERSLQWERESWMRQQAVTDYERYVAMGKDSWSVVSRLREDARPAMAREPQDDELARLAAQYRRLVLEKVEGDYLPTGEPTPALRQLAHRLAEIGAQARDVVRLHLAAFTDLTARAEATDFYKDFLLESRLVLLELMGGLLDIYLADRLDRKRGCDDR